MLDAVVPHPSLQGIGFRHGDLPTSAQTRDQLSVIYGKPTECAFRHRTPNGRPPGQMRFDFGDQFLQHAAISNGRLPINQAGIRPFLGINDPMVCRAMTFETQKRRVRQRLDELGMNMKRASLEAGLGETFVRDMLERDREPSATKLYHLANALGTTVSWFIGETDDRGITRTADDRVDIPELDVRLSAGPGSIIEQDNQIGSWQFSKAYLQNELRVNVETLAVVEVKGDSMHPTLQSGDRVIIDHSDRNPSRPGIYAIWDGDATVVKRVEKIPYSDPPQIVLISDNKSHNQYTVDADVVNVIGRVIWFARRI